MEGLRELVETCHEVATKPPLGPVPHWAQQRPLQGSPLSVHAQRLAALLCERSEAGLSLDPQLGVEEVLQTLNITENETAVAADELKEHGMVTLHQHSGMGNAGFGRISPTPELFFVTDPYLKGWNPATDARALAAVLVNEGKDIRSLAEADKLLSWGPRRLNPAAYFLSLRGHAQPLEQLFCHPYAYGGLIISARTRRFAMEA
jgi:hypothetical protein